MPITKITAGKGLVGGGTTPQVNLSIDSSVVPELNGTNAYKGNQKINGSLKVSGVVAANAISVSSSQQTPNLNATFLGGAAVSALARLGASNTFKKNQRIQGSLDVQSASNEPAGMFESLSDPLPGVVGTGGPSDEEASPVNIPDAGVGVVGIGGTQRSSSLGVGGDGIYGEGGEQTGYGTGGTGVTGLGGLGGNGGFGGTGGIFLGNVAPRDGGLAGRGVAARGGDAELPGAGSSGSSEFPPEAGVGVEGSGGNAWSANFVPGAGALFFGGFSQRATAGDGIIAVTGYEQSGTRSGRTRGCLSGRRPD